MSRVAFITGASRGIGRGIALALAGVGYDLLLNYRSNAGAAAQTAADCAAAAEATGYSIRVSTIAGDVGAADARAAMLEQARSEFGRLDLLVNNAGVAPKIRADLLEVTEDSFDDLIRTNVKGPFFLTQQAVRWMSDLRKQLGDGYRPKIVTVSSISAYTASVNRGDYCISKAALSMVTTLFATRMAEDGIGVFEIRPGVIATDMTSTVQAKYDQLIAEGLTPIRRWGQPEDVGKAVVAIAMDLFPFSTGEIINVDGGFHLRRL